MPRKLRVEYPGAIYHVMNRGDRREPIFKDDEDRKLFLGIDASGWFCDFTMKCWGPPLLLFVAASALASAPQPKFVFRTSSRCLCDTVWNLNYRTNNGALKTFKVNPKNELTNAFNAALSYDGSGNLTNANGGTNAYIYDDENRLIQWYSYQAGAPATDGDLASEFVYDGLGRLRERWEYVWNEATSPIGASWRWTRSEERRVGKECRS